MSTIGINDGFIAWSDDGESFRPADTSSERDRLVLKQALERGGRWVDVDNDAEDAAEAVDDAKWAAQMLLNCAGNARVAELAAEVRAADDADAIAIVRRWVAAEEERIDGQLSLQDEEFLRELGMTGFVQ